MKKILIVFCLAGFFSLHAAEPTTEQTADLLSNRQFRPSEVTLLKAVKFDVISEGKKSGELTVPSGRTVQLEGVKDHSLLVKVGGSEASVPLADTDYTARATAIKQEWDKKSLAEKRAKLIAESPKPVSTSNTPATPSPTPAAATEPASAPSPVPAVADKEDDKLSGMTSEKKKLVRFLTSRPMKCVENGNLVAISNFKTNGTYVLNNGYEGKWKLDNNGDLITYCYASGQSRINRYVFEEKFNKFAGQRDRKSEIQDHAILFMAPQ